MASKKPYSAANRELQPQPKIIDNPPSNSVAAAASNAKQQVQAAQQK
jgi:hypothetical protein